MDLSVVFGQGKEKLYYLPQHLVEPCGGKVGAGSKTEYRFGWVKNTLSFLQITQP